MNWFDILKISFKPVDRDRPAPRIRMGESLMGETASYNTATGETVISPNPNVTPEKLALVLAHESTHEAQFNTEPIMREIVDTSGDAIISFVLSVRETPIQNLSINMLVRALDDVEFNIGNAIKTYLEQEMAIETQAYSLERNFETREGRNRFAQFILSSFEARIIGTMGAANMQPEKIPMVMEALIQVIEPTVRRIFESFVIKLKRGERR
jgi:hypothetical protein